MQEVEEITSSNSYTHWDKDSIDREVSLKEGYFDENTSERDSKYNGIKGFIREVKGFCNYLSWVASG